MPRSMDPELSPAEVQPVVRQMPPAGRQFPCQKCGARLDFDPSSRALTCPYCGFVQRIEPSAKEVAATNWEEYWHTHTGDKATIPGRSSEVTCGTCGAVVLLEDRVAAGKCPYCGAFLPNEPEVARAMIPPGGLLPFAITDRQARGAFNDWIRRRWFAPSRLYELANLGELSGVYVPFWTFDSMTYTHYTGERGDDYTETENYTETDANGQTVTRTRSVTKTRWTSVSGEVSHFFANVLVQASKSLPDRSLNRLGPWDLPALEAFRPEFLSGFQTERYSVGLRDGFDRARSIMDAAIRRLCEQDIGGNHQRLQAVQTQHVGVTFKHLLLPAWVAAYRYNDRTYQILVNGRNGKVVGARPYSWIKITLFVLVILAAVLAALLIFTQLTQGQGARGVRLVNSSVAGSAWDRGHKLPLAISSPPCRGHGS